MRPTLFPLLALPLLCSLASAQCPPDGFEPNDDCSTAPLLGPGTYTGLRSVDQDLDFFRVSVPAGHRIETTVVLTAPALNLQGFLVLREDNGSADPCLDFSNSIGSEFFSSSDGGATLGWGTSQFAAKDYFVQVTSFGAACMEYDLEVLVFPEPCELTPDGGLEDNDACDAGLTLAPGSYPGQRVSLADADYYTVSAGPGEMVTVVAEEVSGQNSLLLRAWEPSLGCEPASTHVDLSFPGTPAGLQLFNESSGQRTWTVRVLPLPNQDFQTGFCLEYDLDVFLEPSACDAWLLDPMEPNGDCASAPLLSGSMTGLAMRSFEQDWYRILVPGRSTVRVLATPESHLEDRSMHLYTGCGSSQDFLASDVPLDFAFGEARTWLEWYNPGDDAIATRLFLWRTAGYPWEFCTTYDLDLSTSLGEPYCLATRNSTGELAPRLEAAGSTDISQGSLSLSMSPLPAGQFGLVFFGTTGSTIVPFGNGYLCTTGPLVRLPVASTGAGTFSQSIDWSTPGAAGVISPGDTRYFQGWYRDPAAGGFNLSEGLRLEFQ